jgi:3-oxoadipate enol-lactonase
MPLVQTRDIKIFYEVRGNGPRVLFISGTGGDLRRKPSIWDRPLSQWFEVLAYDQRGYGQTDKPDIAYSMEGYAADAIALLDELGWETCQVIGVSFGGMVAQEVALRYPHRVERLILAVTSSGGKQTGSLPLHELVRLSPEEATGQFIRQMDTRWDVAWQASHEVQYRSMFDHFYKAVFAEGNHGARRHLAARDGHDTTDRLASLDMPVFVFGGEYDAVAPPSSILALAKRIPKVQVELFKHGHVSWLDDPEVWRKIHAFLRGQESPQSAWIKKG